MMSGVEDEVARLPGLLRRARAPPDGYEELPSDPRPWAEEEEEAKAPEAPEPGPGRRAYVAVGILFLVNLLNYMDRFTIAGVLTDIQKFYGIDDTLAGFLQTSFIVAYMLFAPLFGFLGDRWSRKWLMSGGIGLWSLAVLLSSFVPAGHEWAFFVSRAVVGIGEASYSTVAPTIIADLFPAGPSRSRMLMLFYFAIPVGSGLGFVVGSYVTQLAKSLGAEPLHAWEWGVRVTPILGVVALLLIVLVLQEPRRGESEAGAAREGPHSYVEDLRELAANRTYLWTTAGFTCVAFVAGCLSWWTPTYVIYGQKAHHGEVNKQHVNLVFGLMTCASGFLGVGIGSVWSSRWRRTNEQADALVCAIGLLVSCPFLFVGLNLVVTSLGAAWALMFVSVTAVSLNWSIVPDILLYTVPPYTRSTAAAFQILISHLLGDAFSPLLLGKMSDEICGADCTDTKHFEALRYALFIPTFVVVLGAGFFFLAARTVEGDRRRAALGGRASVAVTPASARAFPGHDRPTPSTTSSTDPSIM